MEPVNRLSINYRGESIELVSGIVDHGVELQDVKDLIRLEYRRRHHIPAPFSFTVLRSPSATMSRASSQETSTNSSPRRTSGRVNLSG